MVNDVLKDLQVSIDKAIEALRRDLAKVRTGRANLALLDGLKVDYYGTATPLNQVASMNVPDPRLITIKPWEKSMCQEIERVIRQQSELGLNPVSDGELVRVPIPPLTQERRKDLVKHIKRIAEEAKVAVRGARREANEMLKELASSGDITEDDETKGLKRVQDATDKGVAKVDEVIGKKEQEIMEI
ncbi:MAG TPA: ribosome recycling factor [Polyangia bacterium]